jgi:hypothetical protein
MGGFPDLSDVALKPSRTQNKTKIITLGSAPLHPTYYLLTTNHQPPTTNHQQLKESKPIAIIFQQLFSPCVLLLVSSDGTGHEE